MKRNLPIKALLLSSACLCASLPAWGQDNSVTVPGVVLDLPEINIEGEEEEEEARQQTVVVRGRFIPNEKRTTSEVASLLNADDFQLAGDSDAAAALSRVAGISTADSKFVYVRGLNERYSSATLNGSPLPSPAPLRRVAPLDLFPTAALESINVQKTYSPDKSAEFGGGVVDIRTKAVPNEGFFDIGFSFSRDAEATLKDGLLYDGSDTDYLGFDDGTRDQPSLANGLTPTFGQELTDDSSILVMQEGEIPFNVGVNLAGGQRFDVNEDLSIGVLAAGGYSSQWSNRQGQRGFAVFSQDTIAPFFQRDRFSTTQDIVLNGLGVIGVDLFADHELTFTGLISRSTEKEARTIIGETADENFERDDALEWFERQLWTLQASGEHVFPDLLNLEVDWRASYSEAVRDAPFQVLTKYNLGNDGELRLKTAGSDNQISFSRVDDDTTDFGIDFVLPFEGAADCTYFCEIDLKAGYAYVENDRFAKSQIFGILGLSGELRNSRVDFAYAGLFAQGDGAVQLVAGTVAPPAYLGTLEIDAGYVGLDVQVTPYIRAAIGGRYEEGIQAIDTLTLDENDPMITEIANEQSDFLPAFTLTWNPIDDLQVRAGYSQSLTRPQFRELAPTQFVNTETDENFVGNPFLVNAELENFDIRAEYYFARDQFLTLGLFYKDIVSPVEEVSIFSADAVRTEFRNAPSAELFGFEIEYEQALPLDRWLGWEFMESRDFKIKTNYTWSDSEVGTDGIVISNSNNFDPTPVETPGAGAIREGRRLQGQSEHLFNLQLIYSNEDAGFDANLLYNFASERIRTAGAGGVGGRFLPDILEQPPRSLDLVITKVFDSNSGEYEVSFSAENIFGEGYEAYQDDGITRVFVDTYDQGAILQFGLKKSF